MRTRIASWAWISWVAILFCAAGPRSAPGQGEALPSGLPGALEPLNEPLSVAPLAPNAPAGPTTSGAAASAADTAPRVEYVMENGVRYRITRQVVRQPVQDVRYEERPQTFYEQRLRTDSQQVNYYTQVPVTQYECVPRLYDWWRVVQGGYVAYGLEPYTTYQTQPQTTTVPITRREVRPVTRTVRVPVVDRRFEDRLVVKKERVDAIGANAPNQTPLAPSYTPPSAVPQIYSQPPSIPQQYIPPRNFPPSNFPNAGSIPPRDPNPFGGFGVATPITGRSTPGMNGYSAGPNYVPSASAAANAQRSAAMGSTDDRRYGGVARFDGDPPRYGAGTIGRR